MSAKNILISLLLFFPATIFCFQNVPVTRPASSQTIHQEKIQPVLETAPEKKRELPASPLEEIISQIFDNVPAGKVVAFVEFTSSSGDASKLSQAIFQEIEPVMINAGIRKGLSFIERKDLKLLLDEWDLKSIYPSKADTAVQMLLGADYILTGKARLSRNNVQCAFKLVDLRDGRIIGTTIANLPAEDEFYIWENAKPLEKKIEIISGPNKVNSEDGKLSVWTNKKTYQIGEKIQIFFEVKDPLYVELIDVTPQGQVTTIFPNPDQTDNYCMPGKVYSIPPENGSFELVITPPTGFDRIKALASTSPFSGTVNIKTRGIQFTKNIIKRASTRANLSFEIQ